MRPLSVPPQPDGHAAPITHVALRADALRLVSCSYDGSAIVWDVSDPTRPTIVTQVRHGRLVNAAAWCPVDPDVVATASADKTVAVWRLDEHRPGASVQTVLARHTDDINSVAWNRDGSRLLCVSEDGRATQWDAVTGDFLGEVGSHEAHCMMVAVSAQDRVATVGEDGLVAVHDPVAGGSPGTRRYDGSIEGCAWSRAGDHLAIAKDDGTVDVLTTDLRVTRSLQVSTSAARSVAWSEDDATLVVGAYDGSVHLLAEDGAPVRRLDDVRLWPRSVSVGHDLVAVGSFWSTPHLYRLSDGEPLWLPSTATRGPNALAVAGDRLYVGCDSGEVLTTSLSATDPAGPSRSLPLGRSPILSLAVAGDVLFAGTYSGHVLRHEGGITRSSEDLGAPVPSLTVVDGVVLAGTYNGGLLQLDPVTLAVTSTAPLHDGSVKSLAPLPDNGEVVSGATDRRVARGVPDERHTLWEHGNLVNAVAQLGGRVVASASRDHTVKVGLLPTEDGPPGPARVLRPRTLLGPDESVKCVGLLGEVAAPVVLAGSYDFALWFWQCELDGDAQLPVGRVLTEFGQGVSCIAGAGPGAAVVAAWDGDVAVVRLEEGRPVVAGRFNVRDLAGTDDPGREQRPVAAPAEG